MKKSKQAYLLVIGSDDVSKKTTKKVTKKLSKLLGERVAVMVVGRDDSVNLLSMNRR